MEKFSPFGETLKNYPQNSLVDGGLKMLQSIQNSTFAYLSKRGLLTQNFNAFGEILKSYPRNRLAD